MGEPLGYHFELHRQTQDGVLRYKASGVCTCAHPVDLVERPDRNNPPASRFVYIYITSVDVFCEVAKLAHRQPLAAWEALVHNDVLQLMPGEDNWYGLATALEPASLARRQARDWTKQKEHPWDNAQFCVAVHVPKSQCRPSTVAPEAVELCAPEDVDAEFQYASSLLEATRSRNAPEVFKLLKAKADPDSRDSRGWTALHVACSTRPCFAVLRQLLPVCDPCARTLKGELPIDLAEAGFHDDVVATLRSHMQNHKTAKLLPQAAGDPTMDAQKAENVRVAEMRGRKLATRDDELQLLLKFARDLMDKYPNTDKAFQAFDINANGTLSASEFVQYAQYMRFTGDVSAVFKALDVDGLGDISKEEFRILQRLYDDEKDSLLFKPPIPSI